MFPLKTDTPFTRDQVVAVTRVMLQIAHIDRAGTAEEVSMIGQFYDGFRTPGGEGLPEFKTVTRDFNQASVSADDFPDVEQREMITATCIMVAAADGEISPDELSGLREMSEHLAIPVDRFEEILALVKDHMLQQLARLPDTGSIIAVAKELG